MHNPAITSPAADNPDSKSQARDKNKIKTWPWNPVQAVLIVIGAFIVSQLLAFLAATGGLAVFARLAGWSESRLNVWQDSGTTSQFIIIVLAEAFVVLGMWLLFRHRKISFRELGFGRPQARDFWLPLVAAVIYFTAFLVIVAALQQLVPSLNVDQKQDIGFDDAAGFVPLLMVFLALVVCAPVAEEVLFRGFLFSSLRQRSSFFIATIGTSILFGAAHLMGGEQGASLLWIAGIDTLLLSVALCYLREKTGRLWASILLHAMKNSLAFVLLFLVNV